MPGMVISQHSGEGKANQYYLRSVDGRLHGPRFWWGACSTAAGPTSRC